MKKILKNLRKKSVEKKLVKSQWEITAQLDRVQAEEALRIIDEQTSK